MKTLDLVTRPALAWRLLMAVIATVMMVASGAGVSWGDPVGGSAGCWECRAIWYGNGQIVIGCQNYAMRGRANCRVTAEGSDSANCDTSGPRCDFDW